MSTPVVNLRRAAREAAGYSGTAGIQRLAKAVKLSASTLYGYEAGNPIHLSTAKKLCKVLGCPLIVFQFKPTSSPERERKGGSRSVRVSQSKPCGAGGNRPALSLGRKA